MNSIADRAVAAPFPSMVVVFRGNLQKVAQGTTEGKMECPAIGSDVSCFPWCDYLEEVNNTDEMSMY